MPYSLDVSISGGSKLSAHLDLGEAMFLAAVAREYRSIYNRRVIPEMRDRLPKVTGRLSRGMITRGGGAASPASFNLTSRAPYGNDVVFKRVNRSRALGSSTVAGLANNILQPKQREIAQTAQANALYKLGL